MYFIKTTGFGFLVNNASVCVSKGVVCPKIDWTLRCFEHFFFSFFTIKTSLVLAAPFGVLILRKLKHVLLQLRTILIKLHTVVCNIRMCIEENNPVVSRDISILF